MATTRETLTKNADSAMDLAKEEGKNDFRFFSPKIERQSIERLMLESHLRHALELNQFSLQYQPKIDATTSRINGVEALLRWTHPDLGNLAPMKFIPLAEETGLDRSDWTLDSRDGMCPKHGLAARWTSSRFRWRSTCRRGSFRMSICCAISTMCCKKTGMPAHLLQLEITESMVMQNVDRAIKLLDDIQSRGVRLAIDDFGTGYSSMSVMKQFPIDTLKIDRSFVRDLATNPEDRAIATAIISIGKALGLTVVAEGVETNDQDTFLREHSCDELQGFLFSKPVTPEDITLLLRSHISSPSLQPELPSAKPEQRRKRMPGKADLPDMPASRAPSSS